MPRLLYLAYPCPRPFLHMAVSADQAGQRLCLPPLPPHRRPPVVPDQGAPGAPGQARRERPGQAARHAREHPPRVRGPPARKQHAARVQVLRSTAERRPRGHGEAIRSAPWQGLARTRRATASCPLGPLVPYGTLSLGAPRSHRTARAARGRSAFCPISGLDDPSLARQPPSRLFCMSRATAESRAAWF